LGGEGCGGGEECGAEEGVGWLHGEYGVLVEAASMIAMGAEM
jgi:hypothetical protein